MLPAAADHSDDISDLRIAAELSVGLRGHPGYHLGDGIRQPQRCQIVDLVQIVELGSQQHLRFVVESRVVAEVQFIEVTGVMEIVQVGEIEAVEREDFSDFATVFVQPATSVHASCFYRGGAAS